MSQFEELIKTSKDFLELVLKKTTDEEDTDYEENVVEDLHNCEYLKDSTSYLRDLIYNDTYDEDLEYLGTTADDISDLKKLIVALLAQNVYLDYVELGEEDIECYNKIEDIFDRLNPIVDSFGTWEEKINRILNDDELFTLLIDIYLSGEGLIDIYSKDTLDFDFEDLTSAFKINPYVYIASKMDIMPDKDSISNYLERAYDEICEKLDSLKPSLDKKKKRWFEKNYSNTFQAMYIGSFNDYLERVSLDLASNYKRISLIVSCAYDHLKIIDPKDLSRIKKRVLKSIENPDLNMDMLIKILLADNDLFYETLVCAKEYDSEFMNSRLNQEDSKYKLVRNKLTQFND